LEYFNEAITVEWGDYFETLGSENLRIQQNHQKIEK
jgi:hypothetical protein